MPDTAIRWRDEIIDRREAGRQRNQIYRPAQRIGLQPSFAVFSGARTYPGEVFFSSTPLSQTGT